MNKDNISILIQGPLNETSLNNIEEYYKDYGEIVVSHWSDDDVFLRDILDNLKMKYSHIVSVATTEKPPILTDFRLYQLKTMLEGFKICSKKYVIKTRSDEKWVNLNPLIEKFLKDDTKLITSNIFWKPAWKDNYHISDHLMISKVKPFLKGLNIFFDNLPKSSNMRFYYDILDIDAVNVACESIIGRLFLLGMYQEIPSNDDAFNNNFDCIDVNEIDEYIIRWNGQNRVFEKPPCHLYTGQQ